MIPFCGIARRFSIKRSLGETCSLVGSSPFFDGEQAINAPRHNMVINFVFFMIIVFLYERECKRYRADNLVLFYRIVVLFLFLSLYLYTFFRGYLLLKYPCVDLDRLAREIRDIIGIDKASCAVRWIYPEEICGELPEGTGRTRNRLLDQPE